MLSNLRIWVETAPQHVQTRPLHAAQLAGFGAEDCSALNFFMMTVKDILRNDSLMPTFHASDLNAS
jgi:hypothetical protein